MQVTASKVRVDFTRLLSQLSAGPIQITKHGKVVAVLVHPSPYRIPEGATTSPDEPLEAVRASEPTQDTSEAPDASQTPSTARESVSLEAEEEGEESFDEDESAGSTSIWDWSPQEEEDFERYLSAIEPDGGDLSEPMPF